MGSSRPAHPGQSFESAASIEKIRDPQTYAIIGAAMEVHRILGCGFLEAVYQEALTKEFLLRAIPFRREIEVPISYKGNLLAVKYKPDFICYDTIIVELKALDRLSGKEKAQVINYLKATGIERGLLLNFGTTRLEYERLILTAKYSSADYTDNADQKEQRTKERPRSEL
ncbi:MAG TPA: GxxExxY protein [Blastocatellia bacterium]|nr:GxxExxY protein [Blastocatellia bacterium]